jgi:hypothetical protein
VLIGNQSLGSVEQVISGIDVSTEFELSDNFESESLCTVDLFGLDVGWETIGIGKQKKQMSVKSTI